MSSQQDGGIMPTANTKTFSELKPGEVFRTMYDGRPGENLYLITRDNVDIFHLDQVIRMRDGRGGGRAVIVTGRGAGGYEGHFQPGDPVEVVDIAPRLDSGGAAAV